ncbi:hypothetical protein AALP_AA5G110200 [Arabis alpina]|uniref:Uncharacterized protein n=1 Tax=Arabis alpina TaxID=50452 RepID=A0A087GWC3_ARAAL|nr:hypothetical protein AALP_AA5G110200 [Arabis alpina]
MLSLAKSRRSIVIKFGSHHVWSDDQRLLKRRHRPLVLFFC